VSHVTARHLSPLPSLSVAAEVLFGRTAPNPAYDLLVKVAKVVDHLRGMERPAEEELASKPHE
jgi:hypothetical protein